MIESVIAFIVTAIVFIFLGVSAWFVFWAIIYGTGYILILPFKLLDALGSYLWERFA